MEWKTLTSAAATKIAAATAIIFWSHSLVVAPALRAETVLAPPLPSPAKAGPDEVYPESHFGVQPGYASRAVTEMDKQDTFAAVEEGGPAPAFQDPRKNRAPAGLEFSTAAPAPQNKTAKPRATRPAVRSGKPMESTPATRKGVQEVAVIAGDLGFFPKTVFVSRDVPVRLYVTGASKNTLCIMMDSFQVRKQVRSQRVEEITFIPNTPGKFRFYCPVNGMEGSLIVKEFASAETGRDPASDAGTKEE